MKILVADDDKEIVELLSIYIHNEGYEVVKAYDGKEALAAVEKEIPDLVILDIMMPEIDGVEVCRRFRANEKLNNVPIVMFSAKISAYDKKESFEAGADGFISKPFNARGFISGIKTYLELGRM